MKHIISKHVAACLAEIQTASLAEIQTAIQTAIQAEIAVTGSVPRSRGTAEAVTHATSSASPVGTRKCCK